MKVIKQKVQIDYLDVKIKAIRQTKGGDALFELKLETKRCDLFSNAVREAVGNLGSVKEIVLKTTVEIRDLDETVTTEEVKQAVKRVLGDEALTGAVRLCNTLRGQALAFVELPEQDPLKLLDNGKVKIGWVICRIRRKIIVPRCFRCLGYEHHSKNCKGTDRSNCCFKCGYSSHKRD